MEKSDFDKNDTEEIFFHQPENSTPLASSSRIIEPPKDIQKCVSFNTFDNGTLVRTAYEWTGKTKR